MPVPGADEELDVIVALVEALKGTRFLSFRAKRRISDYFVSAHLRQAAGQRCFAPLNMTEEENA